MSEGYRQFVLDQLAQVVPVRAKNMFGGVGIYTSDLFFALIADDTLYFKVDAESRPAYEAAGMWPFAPYADPTRVLQYYAVPVDVLEDPDQLQSWVVQAIAAAERARA